MKGNRRGKLPTAGVAWGDRDRLNGLLYEAAGKAYLANVDFAPDAFTPAEASAIFTLLPDPPNAPEETQREFGALRITLAACLKELQLVSAAGAAAALDKQPREMHERPR